MSLVTINLYEKLGSPTPGGTWTAPVGQSAPATYDDDISVDTDNFGKFTWTYVVSDGTCVDEKTFTLFIERSTFVGHDDCAGARTLNFPNLDDGAAPTGQFTEFIDTNVHECQGQNRLTDSGEAIPSSWSAYTADLAGDLWYKFRVEAGNDNHIQILVEPEGSTGGISYPLAALYKGSCSALTLIDDNSATGSDTGHVSLNPYQHGVDATTSAWFYLRIDSPTYGTGRFKITISYNLL